MFQFQYEETGILVYRYGKNTQTDRASHQEELYSPGTLLEKLGSHNKTLFDRVTRATSEEITHI